MQTSILNGCVTIENFPVNKIPVRGTEVKIRDKIRWYKFETDIKWPSFIFMILLHIISLYCFIIFPYRTHKFLVFWGVLMVHVTGMGITAGVHRFWSHRTYKAKTPLKILLAILFYSAGQNPIFNWVRDHRVHHKYTDTSADPHDTNRGFWFSHVGWLMLKKKPEVRERGKGIDMSDISNDPVVQFFDNHYMVLNLFFSFVLPVFIPVYIFGQDWKWSAVSQILMRYPAVLNITWSVNSFAHMFGYHSYDRFIRPVENIWVGFFAAGEGWHNYHHTFPWDYKAAELTGVFFNSTALWIEFFQKIGWAYDLKTTPAKSIRKVVAQKGDGAYVYNWPRDLRNPDTFQEQAIFTVPYIEFFWVLSTAIFLGYFSPCIVEKSNDV